MQRSALLALDQFLTSHYPRYRSNIMLLGSQLPAFLKLLQCENHPFIQIMEQQVANRQTANLLVRNCKFSPSIVCVDVMRRLSLETRRFIDTHMALFGCKTTWKEMDFSQCADAYLSVLRYQDLSKIQAYEYPTLTTELLLRLDGGFNVLRSFKRMAKYPPHRSCIWMRRPDCYDCELHDKCPWASPDQVSWQGAVTGPHCDHHSQLDAIKEVDNSLAREGLSMVTLNRSHIVAWKENQGKHKDWRTCPIHKRSTKRMLKESFIVERIQQYRYFGTTFAMQKGQIPPQVPTALLMAEKEFRYSRRYQPRHSRERRQKTQWPLLFDQLVHRQVQFPYL